jgi:hypothetical protein
VTFETPNAVSIEWFGSSFLSADRTVKLDDDHLTVVGSQCEPSQDDTVGWAFDSFEGDPVGAPLSGA